MLSVEEGKKRDLTVLPLSVSLGKETWLEYEEISAPSFLECIRTGETPTSASPPPALTLQAYDTNEEIIHIAMADGLSGAYEVACGLKNQARHPEHVYLLNSKTLCIPHRILACSAVQLSRQNFSAYEIIEKLQETMKSIHSYLIPKDFDFLRRGGRLTPLAARIVSLLKAVPIMQQTDDGKQLERFGLSRTLEKALTTIIRDLERRGFNENFFVGISHADNSKDAQTALEKILKRFPTCRSGIFELGPAFITQGGPGCVAIQIADLSSFPHLDIT